MYLKNINQVDAVLMQVRIENPHRLKPDEMTELKISIQLPVHLQDKKKFVLQFQFVTRQGVPIGEVMVGSIIIVEEGEEYND